MSSNPTSYDGAYQQGVRDGQSGVAPTPMPANPNIQTAYQQGLAKGSQGSNSK
jgi:hypothetical protein